MKGDRYSVGILGLGGRGVEFGGKGFERNGGFYVSCICDIDKMKVEAANKVFPKAAGYTDINSFLSHNDLDVVVIATPDRTHAECTLKTLSANKHIYLEKPMAQSIEDCDAMIKAWDGTGVVFMVGFELRYCTLMRDCKKIIGNSDVGRIITGTVIDNVSVGGQYYFHGPRRRKDYIVSLLLEKGTHSLDLANWLIDATPRRVYASGALDVFGGDMPNDKRCVNCEERSTCHYYINHERFNSDYGTLSVPDYCVYAKECDVSDNSIVLIDYDSGARLAYLECHFTPEYTREFMFVGDKGKIEALYNNEQDFKIKVWKRHEKEPKIYYPEKITNGWSGHGGGDEGIIQEFYNLLRVGKPSLKGIKGARDSAAIAIAAFESEQTGKAVMIPAVQYPSDIEH